MEKRIVLATRGQFSEGITQSLRMIFGDQTPIECIAAYVDPEVDYQAEFERLVAEHDYEASELIVMTDVLGGSVNNEFMKLLGTYRFHLITGLNLPLLLEVIACPAQDLADQLPGIVERARDHIVVCNSVLESAGKGDEPQENEF